MESRDDAAICTGPLPESSGKDHAPEYLARTSEFLPSWRTADI
jgi:hypothetical protein